MIRIRETDTTIPGPSTAFYYNPLPTYTYTYTYTNDETPQRLDHITHQPQMQKESAQEVKSIDWDLCGF